MGEDSTQIHINRNGRYNSDFPCIHICSIEWMGRIDTVITPFLDGCHPDSAEITQPDGYVCVTVILYHEDPRLKTSHLMILE